MRYFNAEGPPVSLCFHLSLMDSPVCKYVLNNILYFCILLSVDSKMKIITYFQQDFSCECLSTVKVPIKIVTIT